MVNVQLNNMFQTMHNLDADPDLGSECYLAAESVVKLSIMINRALQFLGD